MDTPFSFSFFSTLHGGGSIAAHTAPCNLRLRCHLPLSVPSADPLECGMRVGGETRPWEEGGEACARAKKKEPPAYEQEQITYYVHVRERLRILALAPRTKSNQPSSFLRMFSYVKAATVGCREKKAGIQTDRHLRRWPTAHLLHPVVFSIFFRPAARDGFCIVFFVFVRSSRGVPSPPLQQNHGDDFVCPFRGVVCMSQRWRRTCLLRNAA